MADGESNSETMWLNDIRALYSSWKLQESPEVIAELFELDKVFSDVLLEYRFSIDLKFNTKVTASHVKIRPEKVMIDYFH